MSRITKEYLKHIVDKYKVINGNGPVKSLCKLGPYGPETICNTFIAPTSNCQLSSIGNAYGIIGYVPKEDRLGVLLLVIWSGLSNQMLVDIREEKNPEFNSLIEELKEELGELVPTVINQPYKSTNGSSMVLNLFDIRYVRSRMSRPDFLHFRTIKYYQDYNSLRDEWEKQRSK